MAGPSGTPPRSAPSGCSEVEKLRVGRALLSEGRARRQSVPRSRSPHLAGPVSGSRLARTHLLYGEWPAGRERRRLSTARRQLRNPRLEMFTNHGHRGVRPGAAPSAKLGRATGRARPARRHRRRPREDPDRSGDSGSHGSPGDGLLEPRDRRRALFIQARTRSPYHLAQGVLKGSDIHVAQPTPPRAARRHHGRADEPEHGYFPFRMGRAEG